MVIQTSHIRDSLTELMDKAPDNVKVQLKRAFDSINVLKESEDLREQMNAIYKARNLTRLMISGVSVDDERLVQFANDSFDDVEKLDVDTELIEQLAKQLYVSARAEGAESLVITGSKNNIQILEAIARNCIKDNVDFTLDIWNDEHEVIFVNEAGDEGLEALAKEKIKLYKDYKAMVVSKSNSNPALKFNQDRKNKYDSFLEPLGDRRQSGDLHYSLTILPTKEDAELDGMDFKDYMGMYFKACNQPWGEIEKAQGKLINRLDRGKEIKVTNSDGTNLTFSIEGQTFANSVVLKNVPGSEVFTGPVKESVNGTLVAMGKFKCDKSDIIEDITLKFEGGRVVSFDAKKGRDILEKIITADDGQGEGVRFTGEFGIGTNPFLRNHLINGLLVEKIGQSFHMALGGAYKYVKYNGRDVKVDNGNRSATNKHWDLTTLLGGKDGKIIMDGIVIQDNGLWVDENGQPDAELAVLNYGWGAMPEEERPEWYVAA